MQLNKIRAQNEMKNTRMKLKIERNGIKPKK